MADFTDLLTNKIGPFPGWVWALGVGGLVFLVGPRVLGQSGSSGRVAAAPGGFDPQSFAAGYAQGAQSGKQPQPEPIVGYSPPIQDGAPPSVPQSPPNRSRFGERMLPQPVLRPVGGASRNRSASIGSITADPHAYWHPAMKQQPRYPHFVRAGVGGAPIAHAEAVHQLAHQAEIHPARLHALNPRAHRFVRVA